MATVNTHPTERRRIPDRRANATSANAMSAVDWIAMTLLIVGGVNWGLIGLFTFDLVAAVFGPLSRIIYTLVGVAAVYSIYTSTKLAGKKP
ncbi:DUF378 domain-containing protein [Marinimicrobium sp. ABcell2]|uniref:DUF378 domain-containing protein n=1 Tax=Marinimicrobium sp. ABcell2 TaxID=3069751 RepID=UPI0027B4FC3D|nr:DUF378 domain-containing protein [Marinimicrobium sp. ABcell2]MDQ2076021.1 DUF378 domain-containing protein [Marinimicrobium sp. ABcell2]